MDVGVRLFTWLNGRLVGEDAYGNRYYVHKAGRQRVVAWPRFAA